MNITIKQDEIEIAIRRYIGSRGLGSATNDVAIKFSTTRNPFGIVAELDMGLPTSDPTIYPAAQTDEVPGHVDLAELDVFKGQATEDIDPVSQEASVGTILDNAATVIETTAAAVEEPVKVEETASAPEAVVEQAPVEETVQASQPEASEAAVPETVVVTNLFDTPVAEPAPVAATPAVSTDSLFGEAKKEEAPAPSAAPPATVASLFG